MDYARALGSSTKRIGGSGYENVCVAENLNCVLFIASFNSQ